MYPKNPFSHIDLHVANLPAVLPFYEALLPALGFTRTFHSAAWWVWATEADLPSAAYFCLTQNDNPPNNNLVGFWAVSPSEVDALADLVSQAGGTVTDGPRLFPISPTYYAAFFEDPLGNKYEILHRLN